MRALRFHEIGPIENLVLDEVPAPEVQPGSVLVRWHYAGLNPADYYVVRGQYPRAGAPPFTPGRDGAGVVVDANGSRHLRAGDTVVLLGGETGVSIPGTFAEMSVVPEPWLAPMPAGWSLQEAAATPLVHLTAWRALVDQANLVGGENVLVTGASGGVGTAVVVLAKALGAYVVALSRSPEKREALLALGADVAIDSASSDLEAQVKEAFGGGRADLIIDNLGGPYLQTCINLAAVHARIQVVGLLAGFKSEVVLGHLIHKGIRLQGVSVGHYTAQGAQAAWKRVVETLASAKQRAPIDSVYPLEESPKAFARLMEGPMGKVLFTVAGG